MTADDQSKRFLGHPRASIIVNVLTIVVGSALLAWLMLDHHWLPKHPRLALAVTLIVSSWFVVFPFLLLWDVCWIFVSLVRLIVRKVRARAR
jgi:hypothetical protein